MADDDNKTEPQPKPPEPPKHPPPLKPEAEPPPKPDEKKPDTHVEPMTTENTGPVGDPLKR